jgi:hypothetical protein
MSEPFRLGLLAMRLFHEVPAVRALDLFVRCLEHHPVATVAAPDPFDFFSDYLASVGSIPGQVDTSVRNVGF